MALGKHHLLTINQMQLLAASGRDKEVVFESAAQSILETLQQSLHFDAAWVLKFELTTYNILDIYLHQFCQKSFSRYLDVYYSKAPIPTITQIKNEGFISKRSSDLVEGVTWMENLFYKEVIRPLGMKYFLVGACIDLNRQYIGQVVLWRDKTRHDFSSRDCFLLEKASHASAMVLKQAKPARPNWDKPDALQLIHKRSYPGILILGREDEILYMNKEAEGIFSMVRSGRQQLSTTEEERFLLKLRRLRDRVLENRTFLEDRLVSGAAAEVFSFRGATFSCRGLFLEGNGTTKGLVMILIETVKESKESLPDLNGRISNFTAREGAVAKLVSRGFTNKEIASQLGIGVHTVKDHIKNIMIKLRTNTRSGIVAKIVG